MTPSDSSEAVGALATLCAFDFSDDPMTLDQAVADVRERPATLRALDAVRASSEAADLALVTLRVLLADEDADAVGGAAPFDAAALALLWVIAEGAPELWPDASVLVRTAPGVRWARRFATAGPAA